MSDNHYFLFVSLISCSSSIHLFFYKVFHITASFFISNQISHLSNTHYFLSVSLISRSCNTHLFFIVFHITAFFFCIISNLPFVRYLLFSLCMSNLLFALHPFFSLFKSTISQTSIIFIAHFYSFTTNFLADLLSVQYPLLSYVFFICIFHMHFYNSFLGYVLVIQHPVFIDSHSVCQYNYPLN